MSTRKSIGGELSTPTKALSYAEQKKRAAEWALEQSNKKKQQTILENDDVSLLSELSTEEASVQETPRTRRRNTMALTSELTDIVKEEKKSRRASVAPSAAAATEEPKAVSRKSRKESDASLTQGDDSKHDTVSVASVSTTESRSSRRQSTRGLFPRHHQPALDQIPESNPANTEEASDVSVVSTKQSLIPRRVATSSVVETSIDQKTTMTVQSEQQQQQQPEVLSEPVPEPVKAPAPLPEVTAPTTIVETVVCTSESTIVTVTVSSSSSSSSRTTEDINNDSATNAAQELLEKLFYLTAVIGVSAGLYLDYNTWIFIVLMVVLVGLFRRLVDSLKDSQEE